MSLAVVLCMGMSAKQKPVVTPQLQFDASRGEARVMTMPDGSKVGYTAYEGMLFVTNVEDSAYQTINVYVPDGATQQTPIFLRTYVGGYMASKAGQPQAGDATGRALKEGYVVAIPGTRGRNSTITATKTDKRAGIKTFPMLTGRNFGISLYAFEVLFPFAWLLGLAVCGIASWWLLVAYLSLPIALGNVRYIFSYKKLNNDMCARLDEKTAQLQLIFSLLMIIGMTLSVFL